jgi:hypothetical protein
VEAFLSLAGRLTVPPLLFTVAAIVFLAAVRSRWPWTRSGGILLALATTAAVAWVAWEAPLRRIVLAPARLPVALLLLGSLAALWLGLHQAYSASPEKVVEAPPKLTPAELLAAALAVLLVAILAFAVGAPLGEIADSSRPVEPFAAPWFLLGLAETGTHFDAWVPGLLLPVIFLVGLIALPYLEPPAPESFSERREVVFFFLAALFLLILYPMASGAFLRDSLGRPAELFTAWRTSELTVPRPLSEALWTLVAAEPPRLVWLRELPSVLLLALYFVLPTLLLPRWRLTRMVFGRYRSRLGRWRFAAAMGLALFLVLVPIKMYFDSIFAVGYLVYLPELGLSF